MLIILQIIFRVSVCCQLLFIQGETHLCVVPNLAQNKTYENTYKIEVSIKKTVVKQSSKFRNIGIKNTGMVRSGNVGCDIISQSSKLHFFLPFTSITYPRSYSLAQTDRDYYNRPIYRFADKFGRYHPDSFSAPHLIRSQPCQVPGSTEQ